MSREFHDERDSAAVSFHGNHLLMHHYEANSAAHFLSGHGGQQETVWSIGLQEERRFQGSSSDCPILTENPNLVATGNL